MISTERAKEINFLCPANKNGKAVKSMPDGNGQEFITKCIDCRVDDRGICQGDKVVCCNNIGKNTYEVYLMRGAKFVKEISKGKDEILAVSEVEKIANEQSRTY